MSEDIWSKLYDNAKRVINLKEVSDSIDTACSINLGILLPSWLN